MKFRIPANVADYMLNTDAASNPKYGDPQSLSIIDKLRDTKRRKDGSTHIELDADEQWCLFEYVEAQMEGAREGLGDVDEGRFALAEYNSARAMWRALRKEMATHEYLLMAERVDGTGRMVYESGNDRPILEARAELHTTARTRFWVEENRQVNT